jgi:4-hydroxybenzoate polyprenyltransferase
MTQYPLPTPAPVFWVYLFVVLCYAAALGCVYHAARVGMTEFHEVSKRPWPWPALTGITWIGLFVLFVLACWSVESWAHFRTPFYVYDPAFPDLIPRVPFKSWFPRLVPQPHPCADTVRWLMDHHLNFQKIPLSIPLLEASLTYAGVWTAMRMGAGYRLTPLVAALVMVNVDALLDPVVAASRPCDGSPPDPIGLRFGQPGLGLWTWYVPDGPISGVNGMAEWFGVPLFNYAAWWCAPVFLGSLAMLIQYARRLRWPSFVGSAPLYPPSGGDAIAGVLGLIGLPLFAFGYVLVVSPNSPLHYPDAEYWTGLRVQWASIIGLLVITVGLLIDRARRGELRKSDPVDPTLTRPLYAFLLLSLAALSTEGVFFQRPGVIPVAVVTLLVAAVFVWWPYSLQVLRFCQRLFDADRFLRIHYVAFSLMLVLLGAFALGLLPKSPDYALYLDGWYLAALLGVAICFHIWAFVLNDVMDFEIDLKQERRQNDPLVGHRIARSSALGLAVACVPTALILTFLMRAPLEAYEILILGIALMAAYNRWGKRCPFPPLTDFVQASAWACLPLFAATAAEPVIVAQGGVIPEGRWLLVWAIAVWGGGFILIINGIHGGLRDLANDRACEARTTAIYLGAEVVSGQQSRSNLKIAAFAYGVHALMFALPTWYLIGYAASGAGRALASVSLYGLGAISLVALWPVVRPDEPKRDRWIGYHLLILLLPVPLAFAPFLATDRTALYLLLAAFFVPLLPLHEIVYPVLKVIHPQIAERALSPPAAKLPEPTSVAAS